MQPCGAFDRARALDGDESRSTFFFTPSVGVLFYCSLRLPGWDVASCFTCVCVESFTVSAVTVGVHCHCSLSPPSHTPLSCITYYSRTLISWYFNFICAVRQSSPQGYFRISCLFFKSEVHLWNPIKFPVVLSLM